MNNRQGIIIGDYTNLSTEAYLEAMTVRTAEEARKWLIQCAYFRTLPDKLLTFYNGSGIEMADFLKNGLYAIHTDDKERDTIRHLINGWFSNIVGIDTRTISRNYAFELCFILNLSGDDSDALICSVTGEGIYYRNIEEATKAYCLYRNKNYGECLELVNKARDKVKEADTDPEAEVIPYTYMIRDDLKKLTNDEAFLSYIRENAGSFVIAHLTARRWFTAMLQAMLAGDEEVRQKGMLDNIQNGHDESVSDIVANNLYRKFLPKSGRKRNTLLNCICSDWPEVTQFSRMKNEDAPITRKTLILLFLASDGGVAYGEDYNTEDDEENPDDEFEETLIKLNAMLTECGFPKIDPRQPFDWIVLYCIATGDLFDVDERFEGILKAFGNGLQE